jgi:hypothetical protein
MKPCSEQFASDREALAGFPPISEPLRRSLNRTMLYLSCCPSIFSRRTAVEWTTPTHEEIDLSCEVSSYANAEL